MVPNSPSGLCSSERDREYGGGGDSGNTTQVKVKGCMVFNEQLRKNTENQLCFRLAAE